MSYGLSRVKIQGEHFSYQARTFVRTLTRVNKDQLAFLEQPQQRGAQSYSSKDSRKNATNRNFSHPSFLHPILATPLKSMTLPMSLSRSPLRTSFVHLSILSNPSSPDSQRR